MGKEGIISEVKSFRKDIEKDFGVKRMFLFGSAAEGKMGPDSDVDLLVVSSRFRGKKFFKRAIGMHSYWKLGRPVDFLCYTPEEFQRLRKKVTIVREAVENGIEIN
jgi:hypothetical protein